MSKPPFERSLNSRSVIQLINININCDSDQELDETTESLDDSKCVNDGDASVCRSESTTETHSNTIQLNGNPITHDAENRPAPPSNPQTPLVS